MKRSYFCHPVGSLEPCATFRLLVRDSLIRWGSADQRAFTQSVQPLPREAENPPAHNSGYVYISCTPFDGGVPHTRRVDRAKWCTGNPRFTFDPPEPPGCLPPTSLELLRQQQNRTPDRNLH